MSTRDKGIDAALWILCLDCLALIAWNSLGDSPAAFSIQHADKVLHATSYFTLAFLVLLAAVWRPGRESNLDGWTGRGVIVGVTAIGVAIELAQGLVFDRTADASDAIANLFGSFLAWGLWRMMQRSATS